MVLSAPLLGEPLPLELANTRYLDRNHEQEGLERPAALAEWLRRAEDRLPASLPSRSLDAIGSGDLAAAHELRDALRELLGAATSGSIADTEAAAVVNRAARAAPWWRELTTDGRLRVVHRTASSPVIAALGAIADQAIGLLTGPDAATLRACAAPGCMLFFQKDHPRRVWCSARCSDRVRSARYYARRTAGRS